MVIRISNGGRNMPAFASFLERGHRAELATFLTSRRA